MNYAKHSESHLLYLESSSLLMQDRKFLEHKPSSLSLHLPSTYLSLLSEPCPAHCLTIEPLTEGVSAQEVCHESVSAWLHLKVAWITTMPETKIKQTHFSPSLQLTSLNSLSF